MKGYVLDYINENEFKKLERALKKYNMLAYKKLNFEYYPALRNGKFVGELTSQNKKAGTESYELKLPSDSMFSQVHGDVKLIYTAVMSVNTKAKYILGGLLGIFMFQQLQNMGMLVGLMPITGITLPLISSGGSSLISYMIGLAYAFMVHDHTKKNPVYEESKMPSIISKKTS